MKMRTLFTAAGLLLLAAPAFAALASSLQIDTGSASPEQPVNAVTPNGGPEGVHPAGNAVMQPEAYFKTEVSTHRRAIALFEREASSGNARVSAFAKQQLPILRLHLQMAQSGLNHEEHDKH